MSKLLSERVKKIPANQVSADRYVFLKLSEAEPDLGVPAGNGYLMSSTTAGTRSWVNPATNLPAPGTDGQIMYNNGSVVAGSPTLYFDDINNRIGIGTVSPTALLDVAGDIELNSNVNLNSEATTLATTAKTQIASFAAANFRSGKLIVQAYDSVTGEVQVSELLVAHNGTTASATEYGVVYTGTNPLVVYDVDISSDNVRLMATRTTANSTQYKISETLIVS
jgi:hypothetical protein